MKKQSTMAFARIRAFRASRRNNAASPASIATPPPPPPTRVTIDPNEIEIDDDLPVKEIAIDLSIQDNGSSTYPPRSLEFWKVNGRGHDHDIPICTCGLAEGLLCLTDGLCGIVPNPAPPKTRAIESDKKNQQQPQSPFFLKVDKVDPVKSGFIVPPHNRSSVCSMSRAVSELEEIDVEQEHSKADLRENRRKRVLSSKSLHLKEEVGALESKGSEEQSCAITRVTSRSSEQSTEVEVRRVGIEPEFGSEVICLPLRAGRNISRDAPEPNSDEDCRISSPKSCGSKGTALDEIPEVNTALFSRLPVQAGRANKTKASSTIETRREVSRKSFMERRRCLIAAKKQERGRCSPLHEEECIDIPPIVISQNVSLENEIETAIDKFPNCNTTCQSENHHTTCCNSKSMNRGDSKSTTGSLDYTTESSPDTLEETFDELEDISIVSSLAYVGADDKITKAGWITRQLGREGRIDYIEGVDNVELVYTS